MLGVGVVEEYYHLVKGGPRVEAVCVTPEMLDPRSKKALWPEWAVSAVRWAVLDGETILIFPDEPEDTVGKSSGSEVQAGDYLFRFLYGQDHDTGEGVGWCTETMFSMNFIPVKEEDNGVRRSDIQSPQGTGRGGGDSSAGDERAPVRGSSTENGIGASWLSRPGEPEPCILRGATLSVDGDELRIPTKHDAYSHKYFARKIWQVLYYTTDVSQHGNMDSFLCDLYSFEDLLSKGTRIFWWRYAKSWTETVTFQGYPDAYKIEVTDKEIIIRNPVEGKR